MKMPSRLVSVFMLFALVIPFASTATAKEPVVKSVPQEFMMPTGDPGISVYVLNKFPQGMKKSAGDDIVLYVHGATYPSETVFDLKLNGLSWMEYIAQRGYDVYLVDIRCYGKSTRPPEMDKPASENEPIVHTEVAVRDVGSGVGPSEKLAVLQKETAATDDWLKAALKGNEAAR